MTALVKLNGVSKSFVRGKEELQVLDDIDLSIEEGDFFALMGPSGSGKTTLLNLIGGLDVPTAGYVQVGETRLDELSSKALAKWRSEHVGFIFQVRFFQRSCEGELSVGRLECIVGRGSHRSVRSYSLAGAAALLLNARAALAMRALCRLLIAPNRQFVATRVGKLKATPTREAEDRFNDGATCTLHSGFHGLEVRRVHHDKRATGFHFVGFRKPTVQPTIIERDVVRAIVGERPVERRAVEGFHLAEIRGAELHVVDSSVVLGPAHGGSFLRG